MFDFEATMKLIVALGTTGIMAIFLALGVKVVFFRRRPLPGATDPEQIEGMEDRLARTEAKMADLEERLDFAERMLTEARAKAQLPKP